MILKEAFGLQEEGVTLTVAAAKEASGAASDKERRLLAVSQKQDRLLYLCAFLLLNLSEDPDIERKMQKKVSLPPLTFFGDPELASSSGCDVLASNLTLPVALFLLGRYE